MIPGLRPEDTAGRRKPRLFAAVLSVHDDGVPGLVRLRRAAKMLLRTYGVKIVELKPKPGEGEA